LRELHLKLVDQLEIDYFVNFVIFVPQTGQTALSIALPFDVVSLFTSASFTVTFFLHFMQNISTIQHCLGFPKASPTCIIAFSKDEEKIGNLIVDERWHILREMWK
jgi:hypothetical protein